LVGDFHDLALGTAVLEIADHQYSVDGTLGARESRVRRVSVQ